MLIIIYQATNQEMRQFVRSIGGWYVTANFALNSLVYSTLGLSITRSTILISRSTEQLLDIDMCVQSKELSIVEDCKFIEKLNIISRCVLRFEKRVPQVSLRLGIKLHIR